MQRIINGLQLFSLVAMLMLTFFLYQSATGRNTESTQVIESPTSSYIVQASSAAVAEKAVIEIGGRVTAILNIINAVGAELNEEQVDSLRAQPERINIFEDETLNVSGSVLETHYPAVIGADRLHEQGITGKGITIAVLDTGLWQEDAIQYTAEQKERVLANYDALNDGKDTEDWNGHGTHITSIIMGSDRTDSGNYQGVAPNANVVAVRAFEPDGSGSYLNVIKALDWIVSHKKKYHIKILNLSFGAPAKSHYWDDPVNQAVMAAWKKGIIVVAAAGNSGPGPMTVGVPGNVPYVITVGAMTDSYTPQDTSDDRLASFSAAGPTFEGFVKPDLVAPGGHMLGMMPPYAWLPLEYPDYVLQFDHYFTMSGTSQATAVVSGVLALMLQADPKLKPDDAKCRVMASARAAVLEDGTHAYSVFQQGAGRIDAIAASNASAVGCANRGMSIKNDLDGVEHYAGLSGVDDHGTYYLVDEYGNRLFGSVFEWSEGSFWSGGSFWPEGSILTEGALWTSGTSWDLESSINGDSLLSQGAVWPEGGLWGEGNLWSQSLSSAVSTYIWVGEE